MTPMTSKVENFNSEEGKVLEIHNLLSSLHLKILILSWVLYFDELEKLSKCKSFDKNNEHHVYCLCCVGNISCWIAFNAAHNYVNQASKSCTIITACGHSPSLSNVLSPSTRAFLG